MKSSAEAYQGEQRAAAPEARAAPVPRRVRRSEAKRAAILDAALTIFSRNGLAGTSAEEIATAADVSKTNLFYYFPSKEEIYLEVLRRLLEDWLAPLRALDVADEPGAALAAYIRRKLTFSRDNPEASRLFCLEIVQGAPLLRDELDTALKTLVETKAGVIRAWIAAGRLAPVEPVHLIFAIWATTQHYADFASQIEVLTGQGLSNAAFFEATVRNVTALLLDGLRPRDAGAGQGAAA